MAIANTVEVIDAALVRLATDGDGVLTSGPHDIAHIAEAASVHVDVMRL